jgi:hypothetical protein
LCSLRVATCRRLSLRGAVRHVPLATKHACVGSDHVSLLHDLARLQRQREINWSASEMKVGTTTEKHTYSFARERQQYSLDCVTTLIHFERQPPCTLLMSTHLDLELLARCWHTLRQGTIRLQLRPQFRWDHNIDRIHTHTLRAATSMQTVDVHTP